MRVLDKGCGGGQESIFHDVIFIQPLIPTGMFPIRMFWIKLNLVLSDHIFTSIFKEEHVSKLLEIDYKGL